MKRTLNFIDCIITIIAMTAGLAVVAYFSDILNADDVRQACLYMLGSFATVFFLFGEKVRGGK